MERLVNPAGDTKWVEQTRMAITGTRQGILFGDLYACMNFNVQDVCGNIKLPALVCAGTQDRFVTSPYTRQLAELIPGARYAVIPGGHLLPLEKPNELAAEMSSFI